MKYIEITNKFFELDTRSMSEVILGNDCDEIPKFKIADMRMKICMPRSFIHGFIQFMTNLSSLDFPECLVIDPLDPKFRYSIQISHDCYGPYELPAAAIFELCCDLKINERFFPLWNFHSRIYLNKTKLVNHGVIFIPTRNISSVSIITKNDYLFEQSQRAAAHRFYEIRMDDPQINSFLLKFLRNRSSNPLVLY